MKVSRTSVREALKALSFVKLVTIKPGDGTYLSDNLSMLNEIRAKFDPFIIQKGIGYNQVLETRRIFEPTVARIAAQRATPENIAALKRSVSIMEKLINEDKMPEYQMEDMRFHKLIALSTQNKVLYDAVSRIMDILLETFPAKDLVLDTLYQHKEILAAIAAGDADLAENSAKRHLDTVEKNLDLLRLLDK